MTAAALPHLATTPTPEIRMSTPKPNIAAGRPFAPDTVEQDSSSGSDKGWRGVAVSCHESGEATIEIEAHRVTRAGAEAAYDYALGYNLLDPTGVNHLVNRLHMLRVQTGEWPRFDPDTVSSRDRLAGVARVSGYSEEAGQTWSLDVSGERRSDENGTVDYGVLFELGDDRATEIYLDYDAAVKVSAMLRQIISAARVDSWVARPAIERGVA